MQVEFVKDFGGLHSDDYASAIVDRAGAKVPGIEVSGDDNDLFRVLGSFQVRNHVITLRLRSHLGGKGQMDSHPAAFCEAGDQSSIFGADRACGNGSIGARTGMRETISD